MIAEAGQKGAVTVATSMVGRGTDIKLGEGVAELGGLAVIGTDRMSSLRIDLQLRGRSGRQGDPGFSQFFVSLEDSLISEKGPDWVGKYIKKHPFTGEVHELTKKKFRRLFDEVQEASDSSSAGSRKQTLEFDNVLKQQREQVYAMRDWLMQPDVEADEIISPLFNRFFARINQKGLLKDRSEFSLYLLQYFSKDIPFIQGLVQGNRIGTTKELMSRSFNNNLEQKQKQLVTPLAYQYYLKLCLLKAIDYCWIDQVDRLDQIKRVIQSKQSKVMPPLQEYQREAKRFFVEFLHQFDEQAMANLMFGEIIIDTKTGELTIQFP